MTVRFAQILFALFLTATSLWAQDDDLCPPTTDPIVTLTYTSRYAADDDARARLDPQRAVEAEAALAPLDQFITDLTDRTEALYEGPVASRQQAAACILDLMAVWAQADALSDLGTDTVRLTIGSRLAAFAMVLWQTTAYTPDHPDHAMILAWLDRRIHEQMAFWDGTSGGVRTGNLRAWIGFAAAALALQVDDPGLRDWAVASISEVLCTARPDGGLPQELSRGQRALHYQLHAIAPLVTATVLLEYQDVSLVTQCDNALHRIVDFAVNDLIGGTRTQAITGVEQNLFDGSDALNAFQLAWIEPYLLLRRTETLEALAHDLRPLIYSKLGGNQTELWQR